MSPLITPVASEGSSPALHRPLFCPDFPTHLGYSHPYLPEVNFILGPLTLPEGHRAEGEDLYFSPEGPFSQNPTFPSKKAGLLAHATNKK